MTNVVWGTSHSQRQGSVETVDSQIVEASCVSWHELDRYAISTLHLYSYFTILRRFSSIQERIILSLYL